MEQKQIRLLIVEDNRELCDILESFFTMTPEIELCGIAYDGEEAVREIKMRQPDVVLLDIIMPKLDGISVLERMAGMRLANRPSIIVASAIGQEGVTNQALSLGADYYMIKPYNLPDLLQRICLIHSSKKKAGGPAKGQPDAEKLTAQVLLKMGMPTHMLGYQYCVDAVSFLLKENRHCSIVKEVYAAVAKRRQTSADCVEGAIRKVIRRLFVLNSEPFQQLMKTSSGRESDKQPSNGRFLTMLSEKIKLSEGLNSARGGTL